MTDPVLSAATRKGKTTMPPKGNSKNAKRGVTLVEVMLAGSITAMMVLTLLEALIFGARIAKENSQYLAADAYAFDVAWHHCNESYEKMPTNLKGPNNWYNIPASAAPAISLPGWPAAKCYLTITNAGPGKVIAVDVEWGATGHRKHLNSYHRTEIFKSQVERGVE